MSKNLKVVALIVVTLGVAALLLVKQKQIRRLEAENADLRSQLGQMALLRDSNEHLDEQLKTAAETSRANRNGDQRVNDRSTWIDFDPAKHF
jgi:hypothetical protein